MSVGEPAAVHVAALEAVRGAVRAWPTDGDPAALPADLDHRAHAAAAAAGADPVQAAAMARTYVFAARVGAQAADPERAARWLDGWAAARRTTADEVRAALTEAVRFALRLHRALGIAP